MSRPATGAAALGVVGTRPDASQPIATAKPCTPRVSGTPRTASRASSAPSVELDALAKKLIFKLRAKFGDAAADLKGQEIISSEVLAFVRKGVQVKEEDITALECRIRQRLTGGTPVINTLAMDKKAQIEGDEWARIFQYNIAVGAEKDRQERLALKERQRRTRQELMGQLKERNDALAAEKAEEMAYAAQEAAALAAWEANEAARRQLQHEIALKLKREREEQLQDKIARRQAALARVRQDEEQMAAKIAYETKMEFEKEEAARLEAKEALRTFLAQNEENKAIKEKAKLAAWEEDAYFQKAWRDVLDKQDRERRERLERNMARQARTAAYAASGALPEYKKWIDPAITERHFKARDEFLARREKEKAEATKRAAMEVAETLKAQMQERDTRQQTMRQTDQALADMMLQRAAREIEREKAAKAAREAAKLRFKAELDRQMRENVARRRNQPMSEVERSINHELLEQISTWRQTGRLPVA